MEKLFVESAKIHQQRQSLLDKQKSEAIKKKVDKDSIFKTHTKFIPFDDLLARDVRYPDRYRIMVKKLEELEINVIHVIECECEEQYYYDRAYEFFCVKNDWHFIVYYLLDGDIPEGILGVQNVHHKDGSVIKQYCDLYCQNTSQRRTDKFVRLIHSKNVKEYFEQDHKELKLLCRHLKDIYGDSVSSNIHQQDDFDFDPFIKVNKVFIQETSDLQFRISEKIHDNHTLEYFYYYGEPWESYCNHSNFNKAYKFAPETEISEICKLIDAFISEIKGDYGILEDGELYNHRHLKLWVDDFYVEIKEKNQELSRREGDLTVSTEPMSVYARKIINFTCVIRFGDYAFCGRPIESKLPVDPEVFLVKFKYDKHKDPGRCSLKISSFLADECTEIVKRIVLCGSFTKMFTEMKRFITGIYKVHDFVVEE